MPKPARNIRLAPLVISVFMATVLAVGPPEAEAGSSVGLRFTHPESANTNDLHVILEEGLTLEGYSHVPSPPSPGGDVSWPSTTYDAPNRTLKLQGTTMGQGGTSTYRFDFEESVEAFVPADVVQSAYWTHNGVGNLADIQTALAPYEA